ncbi:endonuclease/exonuclease/phosphatase family protein [Haloferula sp. BvORR071]|uniref:endonuclease/exonuclease/phosphatase family protein n=1 Tax=Haloferula sp. BvORR071 TaxID=1396141 RepID=UPI0022410488|nr:endonuclease/exonuclease/phosphatase family protein [Haloferula sp. BvORR071]
MTGTPLSILPPPAAILPVVAIAVMRRNGDAMIKTLAYGILGAMALLVPLTAAPKSITLDASSYPAGSPITATFKGGPGNNNDWIGIFPASITTPSTGTYLDWLYTNGTQTLGGNLKDGSVTFANPTLLPGNYKVWFLAANGYTKIAGPAQFSVTPTGGPAQPKWVVPSFIQRHAVSGQAYTGKVQAYAYDPDPGDSLSFSKVSGPAWLQVAASGAISGTPASGDAGNNSFVLRATDLLGNSQTATMSLEVFQPGQEQVSELRVMSYNLWHGWGQVDQGATKGIRSIIEADVDIIGTQETVDNASGSNAYRVQTIADELGWYYSPTGAGDSGIASRYPIVATYTAANGVAKGARVRLCNNPLREVVIFNTHLDYLHYGPYEAKRAGSTNASVLTEELASQRDEQIASILSDMSSHLAAANAAPVFLTGDFNCPSHLDWTAANSAAHYGKVVQWPATVAVANAGLTDSFRQLFPNPVAQPATTWSAIYTSPNEPQDRIDFVFHKGSPATPVSAEIFTNTVEHRGYVYGDDVSATRANTWPSDHASVVVSFQLTWP